MHKKIVIDARMLSGTTGRLHREFLTHLEKIDSQTEYHILILPEDQKSWKPTNSNFTLHVINYKSYSIKEQLNLALYLYKLKPDLVHFLMPQQPLLYFGRRVTNILDLTLIRFENLDKNRTLYKIEQTIFKLLLKNVSRRSKRIFTLTEYVKNDLLGFTSVDASKILVTKPAVSNLNSTKLKTVNSLKGKDFIVHVGNAYPHKNLYNLALAFQKLAGDNPNLYLAFVGKQDYFHEKLEKDIEHIPNIIFTGFVKDEELAWIYNHAKLYILPSLSEGFGLPGLEAMQYNLPVVSSNATCLPEVYENAAEYFNPSSTEDIANSINKVLNNKKLQERLVSNGQQLIKKYSWDTYTQLIHNEYVDLLK